MWAPRRAPVQCILEHIYARTDIRTNTILNSFCTLYYYLTSDISIEASRNSIDISLYPKPVLLFPSCIVRIQTLGGRAIVSSTQAQERGAGSL